MGYDYRFLVVGNFPHNFREVLVTFCQEAVDDITT